MAKQKSSDRALELTIKYKGDHPKLIKELKKLITEGQRSGDFLLAGSACFHASMAYYDNGDWDNMFINSIKAIAYLNKTEEYGLLAKAHMALSIVYEEQENNLMSFEECDKAYQLVKKHRINDSFKIIALSNLSTCYQMMGDTKSSIGIADECIKLIEKSNPDNIEDLAMVVINKANFYKESGNINKSSEILNSISDWIDKVEFKPLVCDYYLRLAFNTYKLGNNDEARKLVEKALSITPDNTYPLPLYDDFREIGRLVIENNDSELANKIFDKMVIYKDKAKGMFEQTIADRFFADYYRGLKDYEKATEYYLKLDTTFDKRIKEQKGAQCKAYNKMKLADLELNKLNRKIKEKDYLVSREPLTGLLNRSALLTVATDFIDKASKRKQKVGAIFVDIDFFKECNDTYGHARGDEIIKLVADICKKQESNQVRFARYGGDEFFGITHGLKDEEVVKIAKNISESIHLNNIPNENSPYKLLTLSIGIINVGIEENTKTIIDMIKFADKAMYHAKNDGKNTIYLLNYNINSELSFEKIS